MKAVVVIALLTLAFCYDRNKAKAYADSYWDNPNHKCGTYTSCTPYSYFGNEKCSYESHGGDW